jgi:hypothetical protein
VFGRGSGSLLGPDCVSPAREYQNPLNGARTVSREGVAWPGRIGFDRLADLHVQALDGVGIQYEEQQRLPNVYVSTEARKPMMSFVRRSAASPPRIGFEIRLPFRPLLESWERNDHPAQVRLAQYRQTIAAMAAPALEQLEPPLALGFHVAGRPDIAAGCDLDNFLTPVVKALGGDAAFAFVWATRGRTSEASTLTLLSATDARLDLAGQPGHVSTRISVSATSRGWEETLAAAVGQHVSARRNGPIELGIRFGVSPQRNWVTLWKPAIDALGGILGDSDRPWHPRDDRISMLMLERQLRPELRWDVELDVWWAET